MQQTLLVIPHEWLAGPLFWGWLIVGLVWLIALQVRNGTAEAVGFLPFYLIVALVIRLVLPVLEVDDINPADPLGAPIKSGLAIRGYGVCLLTAILAGVGITVYRASSVGVSGDLILRLAIWMVVAGIFGARLFYVVQKWDEFAWTGSPWQFVINLVDATKGGLVVFGSLIGGSIAAAIFFRWHRLPVFRSADLIAPGMVLGLAIGRIGCLLNGCCYGGVCDVEGVPKISFPPGSPAYMHQMATGELIGVRTREVATGSNLVREVTQVIPSSLAETRGVRVDDKIAIRPMDEALVRFFKGRPSATIPVIDSAAAENPSRAADVLVVTDRDDFRIPVGELPARSAAVHPAQIYSAVDAFLLCLFLWYFWYCRTADGQVFALMLMLHGISRFLLELVRQDEIGAFGTPLTISQWISILMVVLGIVIFGWSGLRSGPSVEPESSAVGKP